MTTPSLAQSPTQSTCSIYVWISIDRYTEVYASHAPGVYVFCPIDICNGRDVECSWS